MSEIQKRIALKKFTKSHAVSKSQRECGAPISSSITFSALQTEHGVTAIAEGRSTCKSIFCPTCRQSRMLRRKSEVQAVIDSWRSEFKTVTMLTLTAPHSAKTEPAEFFGKTKTRSGLSGALARFKERYFWKENVCAYISVLESTFGKNGVHAHYHLVLATDKSIEPAFMQISTEWRKACIDAGLGAPSLSHGINIQTQAFEIAEYLSKWAVHDEVSGQFVKSAKNGNFTLAELEYKAQQGARWAVRLLRKYYRFMFRRRSITYSRNCADVRQEHKDNKPWSIVPLFHVPRSDRSDFLEEQTVCQVLRETDFDSDFVDFISSRFNYTLPDFDLSCTPESRAEYRDYLESSHNVKSLVKFCHKIMDDVSLKYAPIDPEFLETLKAQKAEQLAMIRTATLQS